MQKDTLYVPVTQLDLVSKYIGPREDATVKLSKLGGQDWQKQSTCSFCRKRYGKRTDSVCMHNVCRQKDMLFAGYRVAA